MTRPPPYDHAEAWYPGDPDRPCLHRWRAPRGDALGSMDVEHVCALWADHGTAHWCPCRAYLPRYYSGPDTLEDDA